MEHTNSRSRPETRKRSCSPDRHDHGKVKRSRSRSPYRHRHHHRHRERSPKAKLPFNSRHLHKRDIESHRALFAEYLDLQKHHDIQDLSEDEVKGRWKSFVGKWNRGELAEGWYDPQMKVRADARAADTGTEIAVRKPKKKDARQTLPQEGSSDDDDDYGPALPDPDRQRTGPAVPSLQDLQHRQELSAEDRDARRADLRYDRKEDRKLQKERNEELAPRADPGSRERQLEKKREVTASNRAFADGKEAGAEEVGDGDLMGDDGVEGYKKQIKENEKKKNEREIRKEEVLRARAAEREEKMAKHRAKEDKTMDMLKSLARQRFGGGDGE